MGLDKKGYYTLRDILKEKAQYMIILGERAPGKSYAVKKESLEYAFKTGLASIGLVRRFEDDIKNAAMTEYFDDNNENQGAPGDIKKITGGLYSDVACIRSELWFCNKDENGKYVPGQKCGRVFALNVDLRYKSRQFPEIHDVIFEEFVTNQYYLRNEPTRFQQLVSTLLRKREGRVFMIANTISRVCPYFQEWSLKNIPKMRQGQIDRYKIDDTDIAVEMSPSRPEKSKMFFGQASKSIQGGQWETEIFPGLPKRYKEYDLLYSIYVEAAGFLFKLDLLIDDDGERVVFCYPFTKQVKEHIPVITDRFSSDPMVRPFLLRRIPAEKAIAELITLKKICYSSNLTGSDFTAAMRAMKGGLIAK